MQPPRGTVYASWAGLFAILLAIFGAIYGIWPFVDTYIDNVRVKTVLKRNARYCGRHPYECLGKIFKEIESETGLSLGPENVVLRTAERKHVVYEVNYRAELRFPFTKTLLGLKKRYYRRFKYTVEVRPSGL